MQVSLDPPPRLVGGGDDPGPRGGQLASGVGVRDRRPDELGEGGEPGLGVGGKHVVARRGEHHPPESSTDHDRSGDRRPEPKRPSLLRDRSGGEVERVHPRSGPGPPHTGREVVAGQRQRTGTRVGGTLPSLPTGMEADGFVRIESSEHRMLSWKMLGHLAHDGAKDVFRWTPLGDEGGDTSQGGLLVEQPALGGLAITERGRQAVERPLERPDLCCSGLRHPDGEIACREIAGHTGSVGHRSERSSGPGMR